MQDAWLPQQQAECTGRRRCQLLEVARRGDDEWRSRPPRAQAQVDQEVQDQIPRSGAQGRGPYGTRRIKPLVAQDGLPGSRRRSGRGLAPAGLRGKTRCPCKAPKTSGQAQTVAPHPRHRACTGHAPDKVDVGERTSLPTGAGW